MRASSLPSRGIDRVDLGIVAAGQPKHFAVGGNASHVGTSPAAEPPLGDFFPAAEINYRDAPFAAVRDVEHTRIAADIQAMRALPRRNESRCI